MTEQVRREAVNDRKYLDKLKGKSTSQGQHIWLTGMVFINPEVASLDQHAHLFNGYGCFGHNNGWDNIDGGIPCQSMNAVADIIPTQHQPLLNCVKSRDKNHDKVETVWEDKIWECTPNDKGIKGMDKIHMN